MRRVQVLALAGLSAFLAACAPSLQVQPMPEVKVTLPMVRVLPGNPMPLFDDFSRYPTGTVIQAVAPDRYGRLKLSGAPKMTVAEVLDAQGRLGKALRLGNEYDLGFVTTGRDDWRAYRVSAKIKVQKAPFTESRLRFRFFLSGNGSRALEFRIGYNGVQLLKLVGTQSFVLIERPELSETGRRLLRDGNWHTLAFELAGDGHIKAWIDDTPVIEWTDPDYRQGGFGFGNDGTIFFLDDLEVQPLTESAG